MMRGDTGSSAGARNGTGPGRSGADPAGIATQDRDQWAVVVPPSEPIRIVEFGPAPTGPGGDQPGGDQPSGQPGWEETELGLLCREVGCSRLELVDLSRVCRTALGLACSGLCLWLDEEAGLRDPIPGINARGRRVLVAVWGQRAAPWVRGTAVFTGTADRHGHTQGLSSLTVQALISITTSDDPSC